ncbi:MAG TPA: ABC transporter ATP-binding protein [Thermomicrobiaceae bacterium]|nr:ABC transporter ATP-binding protein [Thermomicrobiaceae bacterium]
MAEALLEIRHVCKYFPIRGGLLKQNVGAVRAVDDVSLAIPAGTSYGLVGESGSGKTTLGKVVLRLSEPTSGEILFDGQDLAALDGRALQEQRARMQMIFQNPYSSLDPRKTVKSIVAEPLVIYGRARGKELDDRVRSLIATVGLRSEHLYRFPHEFSGGQRQRIGIARALALEPKLLILDEPTSALDVSVQSQILNLLLDLQQRLGLTYLFISHDLGVIRYICDHVGVMYLGRIVEQAPVEDIFSRPQHPYTQALLSAIPEPDPERAFQPGEIKGEIRALPSDYAGCRFAPRCPFVMDRCREVDPPLKETAPEHTVACHLF